MAIFRGGSVKKIAFNQNKINEEINQYIRKLDSFTEEELCRIYSDLDGYRWNELMGEKPKDWDLLPDDVISLSEILWKYTRTRSRIIRPIVIQIERMVGNAKLLEWHWIHNLGKTKEQFKEWIAKEVADRYLRF